MKGVVAEVLRPIARAVVDEVRHVVKMKGVIVEVPHLIDRFVIRSQRVVDKRGAFVVHGPTILGLGKQDFEQLIILGSLKYTQLVLLLLIQLHDVKNRCLALYAISRVGRVVKVRIVVDKEVVLTMLFYRWTLAWMLATCATRCLEGTVLITYRGLQPPR